MRYLNFNKNNFFNYLKRVTIFSPRILVSFLFLIFSLLIFVNLKNYNESESRLNINDEVHSFNSVQSSSPGITLFKKRLFFSNIKSLNINFNFISKDPNFAYGNLFQTGNTIYALRMEVQPSNKLILVLPGGGILPISNSIQNGLKYNIKLVYEYNKFLKIFLDGKEAINLIDPSYVRQELDFSNIVLGSGLQQKRIFPGIISEFEMLATYRHISNASKYLFICSLLIIVCLLANLTYVNKSKIKTTLVSFLRKFNSFRNFKLLRKLSKDAKIVLASGCVSFGLFFILIFNYIKTIFFPIRANVGELYSPIYSIFHQPINIFCDFFSQFDSFMRFGPWKLLLYFPASNLLLGFFATISRGNPYRGIAINLLISIFILTILIYKHFNKFISRKTFLNVFIIFFMSYPMLFTFHTGNLEIWVFISLLTFFLLYYSGYDSISVFFLSAAISLKLYPIVFIFILLIDKRIALILKTIFWTFLLTVLPFLIWQTSFDYYYLGLKSGMNAYNELMVKSAAGIHFGHSLLNSYRTFFPNINVENLFPAYYIFMIFSFLILTSYALFRERLVWKRILILVIGLCLLPPTSTDYKLLLFFIPFIYFCATDKSSTYDAVYTLLFALIFVNKSYIIFYNDQYITANGFLNTSVMLLMLFFIVFENKLSKRFLH